MVTVLQDLSNLAPDLSVVLTAGESMSAGNTVTNLTNGTSMKAPGSDPVDPLPNGDVKQDAPQLTVSAGFGTVHNKPSEGLVAGGNSWKKAGE